MFEPIGDKVVIKPFSFSNKTNSGVFIPDIAQESLNIGKVIAIGPGASLLSGKTKPMQCKIGSIVIFAKFGTHNVEVGEARYSILKEQDILTIVTDESILNNLNLNITEDEE